MKKALKDIKVLELTHVISGSYCGMLLGDLGAEVIKIERPGKGEFYREEALKNDKGVSLVYPNYNRNKKGITLNIKHEKSKEVISKLIEKSDIFIENFRPGSLNEMGFGYDDLKKINPKIIMVSISGFGQSGPYSEKPAYDMTVSAMSGFMSVNGPEGEPTKNGPAVSDFLSGIYGAYGAMAALRHRENTGEGQYIDVSMMDSAMSVLDAFFAQNKFTGIEPQSMGNRRPNYAPVNVFSTKDGRVYIAATLQKHWKTLTEIMGKENLYTDERFEETAERKKNEKILENIVEEWTLQQTSDELIEILEKSGIPCAPVQGINRVMEDPHVKHRESIIEFDYPGVGLYPTVSFVPKFSTMEVPVKRAPLLGEHNEEVYTNILGYTEEELEEMKENKVI